LPEMGVGFTRARTRNAKKIYAGIFGNSAIEGNHSVREMGGGGPHTHLALS